MSLRFLSVVACVVVGVASLAGSVGAQEVEGEEVSNRTQPVNRRFQKRFDKRHDRGVYFRGSGGLGWASGETLEGGERIERGMGVAILPSVVVGSVPWEGTALHGGAWGVMGGNALEIGVGPGVTHYFDPAKNFWVSTQAGPVSRPTTGLQEWALGGEIEVGLGGWTGARWAMGGSLFGGGTGLDVDGNDRQFSSWRVGLRLNLVHN